MNNLLPKVDDLKTIVDSRETFSESPLTKDFKLLSENDQLQVLADIVRQTMKYDKYSNPDYDLDLLVGDDYTSSKVFINYLNDLGLYHSAFLVICGSREEIDIDGFNKSHFAVMVEDINNKKYLVDTTPDIGYSFGEVKNLHEDKVYTSFVIVNSEIDEFINVIRKTMYEISNGVYKPEHIELFKTYKKYFYRECFNGLLLKYNECIDTSKFTELQIIFNNEFNNKINELKMLEQENNIYKKEVLVKWKEQLKLLLEHSKDNKAQQKIAQRIIGESDTHLSINIFGEEINLNNLTPRFFWDNGCNVVLIKPSSFLVGVSASAIEYMIPDRRKIITSYDANLGERSELGLRPMCYFHPHGMKYQQQMLGPSRIILVQDNAKILNDRKHYIRRNYANKINGNYVTWFDGSKLLWDTDLNTNLVHSTDDASETCIHFLAGHPEYQMFTRYNYPNPVLRKVKK